MNLLSGFFSFLGKGLVNLFFFLRRGKVNLLNGKDVYINGKMIVRVILGGVLIYLFNKYGRI